MSEYLSEPRYNYDTRRWETGSDWEGQAPSWSPPMHEWTNDPQNARAPSTYDAGRIYRPAGYYGQSQRTPRPSVPDGPRIQPYPDVTVPGGPPGLGPVDHPLRQFMQSPFGQQVQQWRQDFWTPERQAQFGQQLQAFRGEAGERRPIFNALRRRLAARRMGQ